MHHTLAWSTTIAQTAEINQTPVTDPVITIQNAKFLPTSDWLAIYAYSGGLLLDQAKISGPRIRQFSPVQVRPIDLGAEPITRPGVADYRSNPLLLRALEEINISSINSAATSGLYHSLLGVSNGPLLPMMQGDVYTIRGTGTTTLVAEVWNIVNITWADSLPSGRYACVGGYGICAGGIASRFIFEDQVMRPGGVAFDAEADIPHPMFLKGGLGVWGYFTGNRMPNVEFLSISADTAETVYMDFVKIG